MFRVQDDTLLLTGNSETSQLMRLDGTTGRIKWQTSVPGNSRLTADSITEDVVLTHTTGSVTAIVPAGGEVEWSHTPVTETPDDYAHVVGAADRTPVVVTARVGTDDVPETATVYGLTAAVEPQWSSELDPETLGGRSWMDWGDDFTWADWSAAVHVVDSTLLITAPEKIDRAGESLGLPPEAPVHAFDLATGTEQWTAPVNHGIRLNQSLRLTDDSIAVPLGATANVVDGLVTIDTAAGVIGERYLDRCDSDPTSERALSSATSSPSSAPLTFCWWR